ncbi:MAG: helix-turn-helix domain-containing protein [Actinomycetota bacterium]|nr:helix-turn-helix domain-containing protein [Actinomycetota bacterium]
METKAKRKPPATASQPKRKTYKRTTYPLPGLRAARLAQDVSQSVLARRSGVAQPTISHLEWEDNAAQKSTVLKLAAALGVDPREMLRGGKYDTEEFNGEEFVEVS